MQQCVELRGESEAAALRIDEIVKRFNTRMISRQHQPAFGSVIPGKCEHAVQSSNSIHSPMGQRLKQYFCVASGSKTNAGTLQLFTQLTEIINFAIEDYDRTTIAGHHGLMTCCGCIENGKPAKSEINVTLRI